MAKFGAGKLKRLCLPMLAFIVPTAVRYIPEIIAWPYPIGFDTLMYADIILRGTYLKMGITELLKSTSLFYLVSSWVNVAFGDPILTLKLLAPVLFGFLCGSVYIYCRKALGWHQLEALTASLLTGTYFVSLRVSWEMFRQMLGFTFLVAGVASLRARSVKLGLLLTSLFGFLAVWSHELAAVLFFVAIAAHFVARRGLRSESLLALAVVPAFTLFLYQRWSSVVGTLQIPSESFVSASLTDAAGFISGFLAYMFLPLLPLIVLGVFSLKSIEVWSWLSTCLLFSYWPLFLPEHSVVLWFRWAILLVYPVILLSVEGLERVWRLGRRLFWRLNLGGALALPIILLNLAMSGYYLTTLPEHQIKYFGEWNSYKQFIQTSMLQNSVSLSDTPSVIEALKWVGKEAAKSNSVLVLHEAVGYWARILIDEAKIILVKEDGLSSQVRENAAARLVAYAEHYAENGSEVYTVWWVDGKGWYGMPELPPQFKEIQRFGNIGVFHYA
ncbi:MAG: hypothetical protein ACUVQY_08680 [Thermoproteota archaeon]